MAENPYQPGAEESMRSAQWANNRIEAAERNEGAFHASQETRSKSWHWKDIVSTVLPGAIAGLFLLLMLFWVIRLVVG